MGSPLPENCIDFLAAFGDDLMVVNAARVSLNKWHEKFIPEDDTRLIRYMARNNHWTPFGHPQVQFRVTMPIFVARQWTRSVIGTKRTVDEHIETGLPVDNLVPEVFNEVSRRYVDAEPEFFRISDWRERPDKSIKQGSGTVLDQQENERAILAALHAEDICRQTYETLLGLGVAPEQARSVLPQSMMTSWIETGSLAYWARWCGLRLEKHAQGEIRDYAVVIDAHMRELFPVCWAELSKAWALP